MFTVIINYANGSVDRWPFRTYYMARGFCQNRISYSGGRVRRVEIEEGTSKRAMWDASWDDQSKYAGLNK